MDKNPLYEPRRLINLLDMLKFCTSSFNSVKMLDLWHSLLEKENQNRAVTEGEERMIREQLNKAEELCLTLELTQTVRGMVLETQLRFASSPTCAVMAAQLDMLVKAIEGEIQSQVFAFIPPSKKDLFEQDALFGDAVNKAYPDAAAEIKAAANCLAADLNTAAVFHLTRAAEIALIDLVNRLGIKKTVSGLKIADACWGDIIKTIDVVLANHLAKVTGKRTTKKTKQMQYYQEVSRRLREIKDLWRDRVSHGVVVYSEPRALDALGHINRLMTFLVEHKTP